MTYQKIIIFAVIVFIGFVYAAGYSAESIGLIEKKKSGTIDWATGVVQAKGVSAPVKGEAAKTPPNSLKTLSEAKNNARLKLLETVKDIKIDSSRIVGDMAASNKTMMIQIKDMVYGASEIEQFRKYMTDGSVEVLLQMKFRGGFAQLVLPAEIQQIDGIKQIKPDANTTGVGVIPNSAFTGLLVDARGIEMHPALVFRILDENLEEVFGPAFVSREFVVQKGMAAYYTDSESARSDPRISDRPLTIKALRTDWPSRSDIVISNADAAKLRSASDHLQFLKESRVVILLSPPSSR